MQRPVPATRLLALAATVFMAAACADGGEPTALAPEGPRLASSGPVLVECPVEYEVSAVGRIGARGGIISVDGHAMAVPGRAVTAPTDFVLAAPVSNYMEIAAHPRGGEGFAFGQPATITIDYSRCSRSNIEKGPLTVWHIDPDTKALLENMGGVDDKITRTITFQTDHLSHFSIAQ